MFQLTLKATNEVLEAIPKFELILDVYFLQIVEQRDDEREGTIELTINASHAPATRTVLTVVYDLFQTALINVKLFS